MRTMQTLGISSVALVAGLSLVNVAHGTELCEALKRCDNGCYNYLARTIDVPSSSGTESAADCGQLVEGTNSEYLSFNLPLNWAPTPVGLDCVSYGSGKICEAFPQGDSLTYSWSATGSFHSDAGTAANPVRGFSCTHGTTGTITLLAYGPQGASSSASTVVSCP